MTVSSLRRRLQAGLLVLPLAFPPCALAEDKPVTSPAQVNSEDDLAKLVDSLGKAYNDPQTPDAAAAKEPSLGAVTAEMVPATVAPGEKFELVVHVAVRPGVHAYPDAAQTKAGPSTLHFSCASGDCGALNFGNQAWPKAQQVKDALGAMEAVYKGEVLIRIPGTAPAKAGTCTVKGAFTGRYCEESGSCFPSQDYPFEATLTVALPAKADIAPAAKPEPKAEPKIEPVAGPAAVPAGGDDWGLASPTDLAVRAETLPMRVSAGSAFELRVRLTPPQGLHTYPDKAQNPDSTTEFTLPPHKGFAFGKPVWSKAETWESAKTGKAQVYLNEATLRVTVVADRDLAPGAHVIKGVVKAQTCNDEFCFEYKDYPFETTVTVDPAAPGAAVLPPVASDDPAAPRLEPIAFGLPWGEATFDPNTAGGLLGVLGLAGVGGFILNFMPCVLPVIPIKILGLAQAAGTRGRRLLLGGLMSAGVVALWLAMGAVLAFTNVIGGTSDIFSYPVVNLLLGLLIIVMAFAATGFVPLRLPQAVYRVNPRHDSPAGSFGFGVMTGVFALPCIGPFMGGAAAAALKSGSAAFTLAVFTAIGVGMALPYLVLAANPKWVDKLPKAGPGSDVMKAFLGWLMLAGGAYFVQAAAVQWIRPESHFGKRAGVMLVLVLAAVAGLALVWGCAKLLRAAKAAGKGRVAPAVFLALGLGVTAFAGQQMWDEVMTRPFPFIRLTTEAQLPLGKGKIVVVDFRSTNCINCDYNEKTVFNTFAGHSLLGADDVAAYQGNTDDPEIKTYLKKVSSNVAVPFLVVYDAKGREGDHLPGILTTGDLRQAVEKARQSK